MVNKSMIKDIIKEYTSAIRNEINNSNNDGIASQSIDTTLLDLGDELADKLSELCESHYTHPSTHSADIVTTTPSRRFLTDEQIMEFSNKIGQKELDDLLDALHKKIKIEIFDTLDNIINMRKVTDNLEAINSILDSEATLDKLIALCTSKVSQEAIDAHKDNKLAHLNDEDRTNLNILKDILNNGGIDWESDPANSTNAIKNKPQSLPADGGNADTIDNLDSETLLKGRRTSTIVIGSSSSNTYTKEMCDYYCYGNNDTEVLQEAIEYLNKSKYGGKIYLREGIYTIKDLNIHYDDRTNYGGINISGTGPSTILRSNLEHNISSSGYITLDDMYLDNCYFDIKNNVIIRNCKFYLSELHFTGYLAALIGSIITNSSVAITGYNNTIFNNNFISSELPSFAGDNYIQNNIEIK